MSESWTQAVTFSGITGLFVAALGAVGKTWLNKRLKLLEKHWDQQLQASQHDFNVKLAEAQSLLGLESANARLFVETTHGAYAKLWEAMCNLDGIVCRLCGPVASKETHWEGLKPFEAVEVVQAFKYVNREQGMRLLTQLNEQVAKGLTTKMTVDQLQELERNELVGNGHAAHQALKNVRWQQSLYLSKPVREALGAQAEGDKGLIDDWLGALLACHTFDDYAQRRFWFESARKKLDATEAVLRRELSHGHYWLAEAKT